MRRGEDGGGVPLEGVGVGEDLADVPPAFKLRRNALQTTSGSLPRAMKAEDFASAVLGVAGVD
ncbi:hypothetical protein [Streptomyces sp. NPDC048191]|uniref:hypothetical protein n=1 Tax=Streptomyces sp. NPDC048191 TaxID=3155484 RepID=UPI0033D09E7A